MGWYFMLVWNNVCSMWKPVLSAANHVRALLHPAESAHRNMPIGLAVPRTTPVLQLQQLLRRFPDKRLHCVLIAQPVAARDGVVGVLVQTVVGFGHTGRAAFGRNRVAAHGINLGNNGDAELGIDFGRRNGGA